MPANVAVCGHRRQAVNTGTAQGTQQEGLGLIVLVLRQCQRFAVAQFGREGGASPCRAAPSRPRPARLSICT